MIENNQYKIGTIVTLKKSHPSGTVQWEVIRLGADIKIKSTIHKSVFIMMSRREFNKKVKQIIKF